MTQRTVWLLWFAYKLTQPKLSLSCPFLGWNAKIMGKIAKETKKESLVGGFKPVAKRCVNFAHVSSQLTDWIEKGETKNNHQWIRSPITSPKKTGRIAEHPHVQVAVLSRDCKEPFLVIVLRSSKVASALWIFVATSTGWVEVRKKHRRCLFHMGLFLPKISPCSRKFDQKSVPKKIMSSSSVAQVATPTFRNHLPGDRWARCRIPGSRCLRFDKDFGFLLKIESHIWQNCWFIFLACFVDMFCWFSLLVFWGFLLKYKVAISTACIPENV